MPTPEQIFGKTFWNILSGRTEIWCAPDTIHTLGGIAYIGIQEAEQHPATGEARTGYLYNPPWARSVNFDMFGNSGGVEPGVDSLLLDHPDGELFVSMTDPYMVVVDDQEYIVMSPDSQDDAQLAVAEATKLFFDAIPRRY